MKCGNSEGWYFKSNSAMLSVMVRFIDINTAEATVPSDKATILGDIESNVGVAKVNQAIRQILTSGANAANDPILQCAMMDDKIAMETVKRDYEKYYHAIAGMGHFELLHFCLEKGVNHVDIVNSTKKTALICAAEGGHVKCVELLLKHGSSPCMTCDNGTALLLASISGHIECVEMLLKNGSSVEKGNSYNSTPLMLTASNGEIECVKLLLQYGANVDAINNYGWTALIYASRPGYVECAKLLLEKGCNVNACGKDDVETATISAAKHGRTEFLELMIKHGGNVNAVAKEGVTALMLAAKGGHSDCIRVLLKNGANANAVDTYGKTALIWAQEKKHVSCVELLSNIKMEEIRF